ncbi:MAG: serine hydrolase, partial [Sphingomicrobium sp.]
MAGQRIWGTLLCAVLLFAPPPAASAQPALAPPAAEKTAEIIAGIDRTLSDAAANGFGGAIIIEQGHRTLLSNGYGYADRKRRLAFTPGTIAQIGSITKNLTAAALATLIAEHKVALSDTVAKFVPEAPEPGRSRSIAQLLSH